jgi:rhodanese-related sulfurtransferase
MKNKLLRQILCWLAVIPALMVFTPVVAAETTYGLQPEEAYQLKMDEKDAVFFVDVRDPIEIQFVGFTDTVDANIPMLFADPQEWNASNDTYRMRRNDAFVEQVAAALEVRGLSSDAVIITMCRSGSARGEPSAAWLRESGFPNAHFVINGFQGEVLESGPLKGHRLKNGWQNSGLPWGHTLNPDKMFRPR